MVCFCPAHFWSCVETLGWYLTATPSPSLAHEIAQYSYNHKHLQVSHFVERRFLQAKNSDLATVRKPVLNNSLLKTSFQSLVNALGEKEINKVRLLFSAAIRCFLLSQRKSRILKQTCFAEFSDRETRCLTWDFIRTSYWKIKIESGTMKPFGFKSVEWRSRTSKKCCRLLCCPPKV